MCAAGNVVPVPTFGPRMVCTRYGVIGADVRANRRGREPVEIGAPAATGLRHPALWGQLSDF
jgi:hypothetical protein